MSTGSTDALDDLLETVLDTALDESEPQRAAADLDRDEAHQLLAHYYRHVSTDDLNQRSPGDICGAALSHYRMAKHRPQGTSAVRAFTPTVEADGWSAGGRSVVEVVTDDMPFLVDSVTSYLAQQEHPIDLVIHPQVVVERDVAGGLRAVCGLTSGETAEHEQLRESWIHIEIDKVREPDQLRRLEQGLGRILSDVREAVEDWPKMQSKALAIVESLRRDGRPLPAEEVREAEELLSWLAGDHFTFLGYREYALHVDESGEDVLRAVPGSGLGILRSDQEMSASFGRLPAPVRAKAREKKLLIITKANSRSTVHRSVYLDYIGVKTFDQDGEVRGECRFLGLFTSAAYTEGVNRIPVLRRKAEDVLARLGYAPRSHSGKALMDFLENYPRDELFQTSLDTLTEIADSVLHIQQRRQLRLFVRRDDYGRYLSCIVYLPRDRYNTRARLRMQAILASAVGGEPTVDFTARVTESVLARLYIVVRPPLGEVVPEVDVTALEQRLSDATRTWEDDLARTASELLDEGEAMRLVRDYSAAFPEAYKEDFGARSAVTDLLELEAIAPDQGIAVTLYQPAHSVGGEGRIKLYRDGSPLSLSQVLPLFTSLGLEVIDERPYGLTTPRGPAWVYDFGLRYGSEISDATGELLHDAFMACWRGFAEADGFNRLVTAGTLTWRQVSVVRAYARYLRQAGTTFSSDYIEASLLANVPIARLLVKLFETRFDPGPSGDLTAGSESRLGKMDDLEQRIRGALDDVASLDQDRILRSYLTLICATLRTNYFQPGPDGGPKPYLSLKLDSSRIDDLPRPRPKFEIFVYSPRVEGVHLRFGYVARGGLRWSDRREDFRTEVLGLVKAQMVKNAVIVPVGAKGGFVVKNPPDDRNLLRPVAVACYRAFVGSLLDVTDNIVGGEVVHPPDTVVHDGDDPYLVVAADKGTATFSDIANEVSAQYEFWLGDAFASGGSDGYDHKAMGITARGAWESVRRHASVLGKDADRDPLTVVGIGDMSGDVFGNGMLISPNIRLVAAFDHRHVFVDPDPVPSEAHAERRRLFELPRSSWADYDERIISEGGGVYARDLKAIELSASARRVLGASEGPLTPNEVISAVLRAPVDLLWNGGVGTYVKATIESSSDVGDRANDSLRVNGAELRAKMVGEGGNLGFTQLGRVEYDLHGGLIYTDAIDNSAGVDCSDHEVNLKILLDGVVADGEMTLKQRNALLDDMTDEVASLVLDDNRSQTLALMIARQQSLPMVNVHARYIDVLEGEGWLNRGLEFLPTDKQIAERQSSGNGLCAPEFAVLIAYTKNANIAEIMKSDLPDDPMLEGDLIRYFPTALRQRYGEPIRRHRLRREIITTQLVNQMVNLSGISYDHRMTEETGSGVAEVTRAWAAAREILDFDVLWDEIETLDEGVPLPTRLDLFLDCRRMNERASLWLLRHRHPPFDISSAVEYFKAGMTELTRGLGECVVGRMADLLRSKEASRLAAGVPEALAERSAIWPLLHTGFDLVETATKHETSALGAAGVYWGLHAKLDLLWLWEGIGALPRSDRWESQARSSLRDDLLSALADLTEIVLRSSGGSVDTWIGDNRRSVARVQGMYAEIRRAESYNVTNLSVALRQLRNLALTSVNLP